VLRYRPPFAWQPLLSFLAARAIPGVESVTDESYRRTIEIDGRPGSIEIRHEPSRDAVTLRASLPDRDALSQVVDRVRRVFDLDVDPSAVAAHVAADPVLAPRVRRLPGLRVPGAWDAFELGIRAVLGQQVTVKGASTLAGRLVTSYGRPVRSTEPGLTHLFPSAADLAIADFSTLGVPSMRRATLLALARAVADGSVSFTRPDLATTLVSLPGIGDWTAQYVLMRACGDRDAFPASDLWLRRSAGAASTRALVQRAEAWRPYRAYAAMYLWQAQD
jgi:AraC family transcriptional regulator of adaptative response / DNA-3-methyladenine glycosylase II